MKKMVQITKWIKKGLVRTSSIVSWSQRYTLSRWYSIKSYVLRAKTEVVYHIILPATGNYFFKNPLFSYTTSFIRYFLQSKLILILITLFLCYYFPIIVSDMVLSSPSLDIKVLDWNLSEKIFYRKNNISIFNLFSYFIITSTIGYVRFKNNNSDLFKLLYISLKKAMFSILSLNYIKTRLIYLIIILPFLFILFGNYTYLLLNFGLIFNNIIMLQIFIVNNDKKFLIKIWQGYFYILLSDIFMLGLIYIFKDYLLFIGESFSSYNGSSSNKGEFNTYDSDPNFNSNNSYFHVTSLSEENERFIDVLTTLPIKDELPIIYTDRLIIRPPIHSDIDAYYSLRIQPEAMTDSSRGIPDADLSVTLNKLERLIKRDNDSIYFFIFLKNLDGSEGNFIGDGGVHNLKSDYTGWPEFGYKLKKEFWGKGYATEFGKAFMEFWGDIPRKDVKIPVNPSSIDYQESLQVKERLTAYTRNENLASQNVLWKLGFQSFKGLKNGLINWRKII